MQIDLKILKCYNAGIEVCYLRADKSNGEIAPGSRGRFLMSNR